MRIVALFLFIFLQSVAHAWDPMYQCTDGTFTNRADLHCAVYGSPPSPDETSVPMVALTAQPKRPAVSSPARSSPPSTEEGSTRCLMYRQWLDLDRPSNKGAAFATANDQRRWTTLSRMYRSFGTPGCDISPPAATPTDSKTP